MASPLLGYNNNVRHRGRVFHIQTEDSGLKHPHVITHLFADGGRILKTVKTSYAEHVGTEKLEAKVRELMKAQHKSMFMSLRDGEFDHLVGLAPPPPDPARLSLATIEAVAVASEDAAGPTSRAPQRAQAPDLFTDASQQVPVDIATLERAALAAQAKTPSIRPEGDLPPPPPSMLAKKVEGAGTYRGDGSERIERVADPPKGGRYAQTRPAAIFASNRPAEGSIFGEDLISEKSLDEVILSYLAEDLEESG